MRAMIEVGFIIFLFYSNLLMGEFTGSGKGQANGILWAVRDIFTLKNFLLAVFAAVIGYIVVEFLRSKYFSQQ
jgi:hypothetical protein